jgi:multiple sugar transport system permease protein
MSVTPASQGRAPAARPGLGIRSLTYWQRDRLTGYLFVSPLLVGFVVFVLGPILSVFWYSLHDWTLIQPQLRWNGLGNFQDMLDDHLMPTVAWNSIVFALGYVPLTVGLGLVMALGLNRAIRGISLFRTFYFMPVVVSLVAWTIVWRFILNTEGVLNAALAQVGIDGPNWLRDPALAMASVIVIQILKNAGLSMVLFLAALQGVPKDLEEAARVDGAGDRQVLRHITLPLITAFIFLATVLAVITSFKAFSLIYLTTLGGPGTATTVLAYYIYEEAFRSNAPDYASALAVVLFVCVLILTIIQFAIRKRWVFYES